MMKEFVFIVTLTTGVFFECSGVGYNKDAALMDACEEMAKTGDYPEDEVEFITLKQEENV